MGGVKSVQNGTEFLQTRDHATNQFVGLDNTYKLQVTAWTVVNSKKRARTVNTALPILALQDKNF